MTRKDADWKGAIKKRFRWRTLRFEYGRWCYQTNCFGGVLAMWFEWEANAKVSRDE